MLSKVTVLGLFFNHGHQGAGLSAEWDRFKGEHGERNEYKTADVYLWLGY